MRKNISFRELIKEYSIHIPEIQRDYAQGRTDTKSTEIRNRFLEDIFNTLLSENSEPLVLDFIYGSADDKKIFTPLDGQQRLTTLFLLHWYLANEAERTSLQRFTYAARISSKDFCNELVKHSLEEIKTNIEKNRDENDWKLSDAIKNESWFQWSWHKDPTITGMLTMLDAIDEKIKDQADLSCLWKRITEEKRIIFHLLPLNDFDLTDELYVKMNARGKELSPFDILKSTFEEQMRINNVNDDIQEEWRTSIDSKWMDLFWNKKAVPYLMCEDNDDEEENVVGKVETYYLRFMERMIFFHLFLIDDFENPDKQDIITIIPNLEKYGFFNEAFFSFVINTMNEIVYKVEDKVQEGGDFIKIPFWNIDNQPVNNLFDLFVGERITYLGRILFFGQMQFFKYHHAESVLGSDTLKDELNRWMRIVRNLAYNSDLGRDFREGLESLKALADKVYSGENEVQSVLDYLVSDGKISYFNQEQVKEEREKARQIVKNKDWEDKIEKAENHAFFQGCIRFLFTDREDVYNWNLFDFRYKNAQKFFDVNGVSPEYKENARLVCTFISLFTKWEQCWNDRKAGIVKIGNGIEVWRYIIGNINLLQPLADLLDLNEIPFSIENFSSKIDGFSKGWEIIEKSAHEDMCNNKLIDNAISTMGEGILLNFNWKEERYVLYRPSAKVDLKKYVIGSKRNQILFDLIKDGLITTDQNISGLPYFWGWDIYFTYRESTFVWHSDWNIYFIDNDKWIPCIEEKDITDRDKVIEVLDKKLEEK